MNPLHEVIENLEKNKISYTLYYDPDGFESVKKVVEKLNVDEDMILKTMVVWSRKGLYTFLIRGGKKLNLEEVRLEIQDGEARLANKEEIVEVVNLVPGALSPLHPNIKKTIVYIDLDSTGYNEVIVGGGTVNHVVKVTLDDIIKLLKPYYIML